MRSMRLLVSVLALAAGRALADVDAETSASLKAKSTLAPEGEVETFRFDATAGTRLSFSLTTARGASLQFAPVLTAPDASDVPLGGAVKVTRKRLSVSGLGLAQTGTYVLTVSAAGTGDYALALSGTPQKRFALTGPLDAAGQEPVEFSAPPGSTVTLSVKPVAGSAARPHFGVLSSDGFALDLTLLGRGTESSHVVSVPQIGGTGDYVALLGNVGTAGDVVVSVVVKPPRRKPAKLDLRAKTLGHPGGGETFYARAIGPEGGSVDVTGDASDLSGASVAVPAGALTATLPVSISSSLAPSPPSDDDQAAGPAIDLRPSGTVFLTAVSVTLPFDFSMLPANADPEDIRVLVTEADGSTREIVPFAVDALAGTVTVLTSSFSVCVPIVRSGAPRLGLTPGGDEYWVLFLHNSLDVDPTDSDSRGRDYGIEVGEASFFSDNTLQATTEQRSFRIDNPDGQSGGVDGTVTPSVATNDFTGTWIYGADFQSIEVGGAQDTPVLRLSRDGSVLVGRGRASDSNDAELDVLLRKNTAPLTVASLVGSYAIAGCELRANAGGLGNATRAEPATFLGTATFDGAGGVRISLTQRNTTFDGGTGVWSDSLNSGVLNATYTVEAAGTVLVQIPPEDDGDPGSTLRFLPGPGANSFVGTDRDAQGDNVLVVFLLRQGSGLSRAALNGSYRLEDASFGAQTYQSGGTGPVTVPDLSIADEDIAAVFDGSALTVSFDAALHDVSRDGSVAGGVRVHNDSASFGVAVAVSAKGNLTLTDTAGGGSYTGAISSDGMLGIYVSGMRIDPTESHVLGLLVRLPRVP